jgi:acyl-coenzyme A thioesterase PaaI-like protein
VNLLRPARGARLRCRAAVLKAGRTLTVVEAEVRAGDDASEVLVSKATVTLATVPRTRVAGTADS